MSFILSFGKHKGEEISTIPLKYLVWLACYDVKYGGRIETKPLVSCRGGRLYLLTKQKPTILAARCEMKHRRICFYCMKVMPAIGWQRENGKSTHGDWATRKFHKKCLKELN